MTDQMKEVLHQPSGSEPIHCDTYLDYQNWNKHGPLRRAIREANWEKTEPYLRYESSVWDDKIDDNGYTPIHLAINKHEHMEFFEKVLDKVTHNLSCETSAKSLQDLVCKNGSNALHHAAKVGNTEAAKKLVDKDPLLLYKVNCENQLPIHVALTARHIETFGFLFKASEEHVDKCKRELDAKVNSHSEQLPHNLEMGSNVQCEHHSPFEGKHRAMLLNGVINAWLMDVAYRLINADPVMDMKKFDGVDSALKTTVNAFYLYHSHRKESWNHKRERSSHEVNIIHNDNVNDNKPLMVVRSICNEVGKSYSDTNKRDYFMEAATYSVRLDIVEALEEITECFPDAIWLKHECYTLIEYAILHRSNKVFDLLVRKMTFNNRYIEVEPDKDGNNLLHLAGKLVPIEKYDVFSDAGLHMQMELLWFKKVEKFVHPKYNDTKNHNQETPLMVFRREHKELKKRGAEWMKMIAKSFLSAFVLIIAIAFGMGFKVPRGIHSNNGSAYYGGLFDLALYTSIASFTMLVSFFMSRYTGEDFSYKLHLINFFGVIPLILSSVAYILPYAAWYHILGNGYKKIMMFVLACTLLLTFMIEKVLKVGFVDA